MKKAVIFALALCFLGPLFFTGCSPRKETEAVPDEQKQPVLCKNPYAVKKARQKKGSGKPKLCLNMIVKNESQVIQRCLDSVIPLIDYWVILDTGSTDKTQEIIQKHLKDIPGELYENVWKDWGKSRTEAFNLAKGKAEYVLFMDADDILLFDGEPKLPPLTKDQYRMWRGWTGCSYEKQQIVRGDLPWQWIGVTHEYIDCPVPFTSELLENVRYRTISDGASSKDPKKFHKNIALLKKGMQEEPDNQRYAFYLAESYRCAGKRGSALEWYQKRVEMGGWEEEVFLSKLQIAHLLQDLDFPTALVVDAYRDAAAYRPHRSEPTYYLAALYNEQKLHHEAYFCLKAQERTTKPHRKDTLFNMDWIEDCGLLFQLSIAAYYVGNYQEALDACDQLLKNPNLPPSWKTLTEQNRLFPLQKLKELSAN